MGSNVEIKARLRTPDRQRELAAGLADGPATSIEQRDTFFEIPQGRLKLRQLGPERGELIFYHRADAPGPKRSEYSIVATSDPVGMRILLSAALGARGEVRKTRTLFLVGQTRIHLDAVDSLGDFLELEVVLAEGQSTDAGEAIARELMLALEVPSADLVEGAYLDLLLAQRRR